MQHFLEGSDCCRVNCKRPVAQSEEGLIKALGEAVGGSWRCKALSRHSLRKSPAKTGRQKRTYQYEQKIASIWSAEFFSTAMHSTTRAPCISNRQSIGRRLSGWSAPLEQPKRIATAAAFQGKGTLSNKRSPPRISIACEEFTKLQTCQAHTFGRTPMS